MDGAACQYLLLAARLGTRGSPRSALEARKLIIMLRKLNERSLVPKSQCDNRNANPTLPASDSRLYQTNHDEQRAPTVDRQ